MDVQGESLRHTAQTYRLRVLPPTYEPPERLRAAPTSTAGPTPAARNPASDSARRNTGVASPTSPFTRACAWIHDERAPSPRPPQPCRGIRPSEGSFLPSAASQSGQGACADRDCRAARPRPAAPPRPRPPWGGGGRTVRGGGGQVRGVQCVGRLDADTSGLLLLTDDGQARGGWCGRKRVCGTLGATRGKDGRHLGQGGGRGL
jgi:hypothetical protein